MFIRQNIDKWRNLELLVDDALSATPEEIGEAYVEIMSDLSFAQTHYPDSRVTGYLNNLALALHHYVYRHDTGRWRQVVRFWTHGVPLAVYDSRKSILAALAVFVAAYIIGIVSQWGDLGFTDAVMGSGYMDMTRENIAQGKPMGVYGNSPQGGMFLMITFNNVMVAFTAFSTGVFTSILPGALLLRNGVMLGAFHTFFMQQYLLGDCLYATMLHGTLELSAIVISGGAGFVLGNGWLFPGTYSRARSFLIAGRKSVRIFLSTVPIFVVAGFIESFMTRYTDIGDAFRLMIILASAAFIVSYYILLPIKRHRESAQIP